MKSTRTILILALGLALLLAGCAQEQQKLEYIGTDAAKSFALAAAGLTADQVEFSGTDMGTRSGLDYYQVAFQAAGGDYRYDVDALTGVVIDSQTPQDAAESGTASAEIPNPEAAGSEQTTAGVSGVVQSASDDREQTRITEEEARAAALAHAGLAADQVTFVKSGMDRDDGRLVYDVEFYSADHVEYDYDIDAATGEILSYDHDAEYYAPPAPQAESTDSGAGLTADEAKAIALAQVPGASAGDIREFEADYDDGRLEYEGKIYYDHMEYEFEIDGYSGAIRNWEVESIYD